MFDASVDTAQERAPAYLYSEKTTRLSGPSAPRMVTAYLLLHPLCKIHQFRWRAKRKVAGC